ncbi:MAG: hypothetical protein VYE31_03885 [Pseudomonadota bacterium]|nr:hypothetical protein [Pseudomonadota bacterium]
MEKNLKEFFGRYSLEKRNYNIIVSGINGMGKYEFIKSIIKEYFDKNNISIRYEVSKHPDVHHLSLPIYDDSGKIKRTIDNNERLLYKFGFEKKSEEGRIGKEITVDQVRNISEFVAFASRSKHKFIIINNAEDLNREASAALLKTLEETSTPAIFFLLTSEINFISETIKSRCHVFNFISDEVEKHESSLLKYFLFSKSSLKNILEEENYLENFENIETELNMLKNKKIDPLNLSEQWNDRGIIIIDYLISIFNLLMKGKFLDENSPLKKLYVQTHNKIKVCPQQSIEILKLLLNRKKYLYSNINHKFYFDNLVIVLSKNLY